MIDKCSKGLCYFEWDHITFHNIIYCKYSIHIETWNARLSGVLFYHLEAEIRGSWQAWSCNLRREKQLISSTYVVLISVCLCLHASTVSTIQCTRLVDCRLIEHARLRDDSFYSIVFRNVQVRSCKQGRSQAHN